MYENGGSSFAEGYAIGRDTTSGNAWGNGFGGDWAWWIVILLIFGWGNGGFGFGGRNGGVSAMDGYVLTSDFANIERKLDGVNNGLCDGFYAMNTGMLNGFGAINTNLMTQGFETRNAIQGVSTQLASCCCGIEKSLLENRYLDAQNFAGLSSTICGSTRDIIENANANYRAIHEELVSAKLEAKNEKIAEQQATISALQLKASQEAQNNYLINELKPCPRPAYITCNPYQSYPYYTSVGTGCGCGASIQ